jgi:hypothetical protein
LVPVEHSGSPAGCGLSVARQFFISDTTAAKPQPVLSAGAALIVALSASRFVCLAILEIALTIAHELQKTIGAVEKGAVLAGVAQSATLFVFTYLLHIAGREDHLLILTAERRRLVGS